MSELNRPIHPMPSEPIGVSKKTNQTTAGNAASSCGKK